MGPYAILGKVGAVAYHLALPPELSSVHHVFHVSMLRMYISYPSHVLQNSNLQLYENLTYEEEPTIIIDRQVRRLRSKDLMTVKVVWKNHPSEEATWKDEKVMQTKYPHLFESAVAPESTLPFPRHPSPNLYHIT
uniref:Tf2-1-like SH3-like domain-containing protein n=1 Tax=Nicotiana tabacum TaxID=4097 RepID=A0A1S4CZF1_TOBAC|nr:PREDICTED: uncharacterized protein LOC107824156 [Nicotiana tabacum]